MSKYIKREWLSEVVYDMIVIAKTRKKRIGIVSLAPRVLNSYWCEWLNKVESSINHYLENAQVYIDINPFDNKYTIGQLEVIKFVLDRRHKNGY